MKKIFSIILALLLVAVALSAHSLKVEKKEEIRKTLKFKYPAKVREVQIDNIFGSIKVTGYAGQEVKLIVHKTIRARNEDKIQKAREEVSLEITEDGNTIDLYVDGPFRCKDHRGRSRWRDPGYQVHFDFQLMVPHKTSLFLKTVTEGDIRVEKVEGEYEIKNVNGEIEMIDVAGSGIAHTVNGKVKVIFSKNPPSDCSFKTINGDLDIYFRGNLSSDFRCKTFNGDVYTDFPVKYLPAEPPVQKRHKGRFVYKSSRFFGIRVGKGGPEIKLDTFNGDILINKR